MSKVIDPKKILESAWQKNVRNGEESELEFTYKCFREHGYMVSKPIGTTDYDLIVEVYNKPFRVQVKSTRNATEVTISKGTNQRSPKGQGKYPYPEDSIDFFAIHDVINDEWFIIPRKVTGDSVKLRFSYKPGTKYVKYLNNWEFKEEFESE
tara:strand:+ start:43 stop:498 length:456 start_codon:yes stop_codon:yes gene_type:complete